MFLRARPKVQLANGETIFLMTFRIPQARESGVVSRESLQAGSSDSHNSDNIAECVIAFKA